MTSKDVDPIGVFEKEQITRISNYPEELQWHLISNEWINKAFEHKYMYNFNWMGQPILQIPIDLMAMQEIIWKTQPDLIIETGIAHGGSLLFYASMLELISASGARDGEVLGIEKNILPHCRRAIEEQPISKRISMIEGSSIAPKTIELVHERAKEKERVIICLDAYHTHDHVLAELNAYAPLTSVGSYCVVFDTIIEDMPPDLFANRPWGPGNNPKTAVREYLKDHTEFAVDKSIEHKLLITLAPGGYLKRLR